jgi:type II restriction enzyme
MNLSMRGSLADRFTSGSQKAGNVTEAWGADNFYCPNCSSPKLDWLKPGTKANDYHCPNASCGFWYQLKSKKSRIGNTIQGGAFSAVMEAMQNDRSPNYFLLHYNLATWSVCNLLLIPYFALSPSAIIQRNPTTPKGRSGPWFGCNITLKHVPLEARIAVVTETKITPEKEVREKFKKVKPLKELSVKERGWTLDLLNGVRSLGKKEFTNTDAYTLAGQLEKLHPDNRHVRDKIRQQLQVLRDAKLLIHVSSGVWRLGD